MGCKRVGILISGRGSNMVSLIEAANAPDSAYEVACVISNRPDAPGLEKATAAGIATVGLDHKQFDSREALDSAVHEVLVVHNCDLVACAGYMRIMEADLINKWQGRMVNIHPSLLPLFKGLDTHRRALEAGVRVHGCTVHFVSAELDAGAIIAQGAVPVIPGDTEDTLAARVLKVEHQLYPAALNALASGTVKLEDGRCVVSDSASETLSILSAN